MARAGIIFLVLLFSLLPALAINEDCGFRDLRQPDGTIFTVHKFIDEFGRFMTVDGGFVIQDPRDGYYYYAHIAEDGTVTPSQFKVGIDDEAEVEQVIQQSSSALRKIRRKARAGEVEFPRIDLWVSYMYEERRYQPDGTPFTTQLFMDEVGRYLTTEKGYVVLDERDGYYYYAHIAEDGTVTPSQFKVGIDDEAAELKQVLQQSRSVVEELASRYHNGEEVEDHIDLWVGYDGWVSIHGSEEEALLCDVLEIPRDEDELILGFDYTPGYILVFVRSEEQTLFDKLKEAATQDYTILGVAPFDSVSVVYHLEEIQLIAQNVFALKFREDSKLIPIAKGYCGLPYFEAVIMDRHVPTNLIRSSWGALKQDHWRQWRPRTKP